MKSYDLFIATNEVMLLAALVGDATEDRLQGDGRRRMRQGDERRRMRRISVKEERDKC